MLFKRTLPPAAAPIYIDDIISGVKGYFSGQQEIERFRTELKAYFGVRHCFLVSSGKAALTIILKVLQEIHPERKEIVIPAYNCFSVPSAITRAGLKTSLCDINEDTLDFNYTELSKVLNLENKSSNARSQNKKKLAVIATHLFGIPADVEKVRTCIDDPNVPIIEDAAQAMGGEYNGKKIGTRGDVSFFSLGRGKAFSTIEGGIILTDRDTLAEEIKKKIEDLPSYSVLDQIILCIYAVILNVFMRPCLFWLPKSLPFLKLGETIYDPNFILKKMSPFQAGLARNWQEKLKSLMEIRSKNAKHFGNAFRNNVCNKKIKTQDLKLSSPIRFLIKIEDRNLREDILKKSEKLGLGIMATYPDSVDRINELMDDFEGQNFPVSMECAKKIITLPIHPFVSNEDKTRIVKQLVAS